MMGTSTPDQDVGRRRAEEDEETLTGSSSKKTPPKKTPVSDRWNHYTFKPVLADLLELEIKHVMLTTLGALIDGHDGISDWIPRNRDPSVRIREPRAHRGLPLIVTPFVMETKAAWEAVEAGEVVDHAFVETAPIAQALRAELAHGPAKAN